jgi:hypothetical protein
VEAAITDAFDKHGKYEPRPLQARIQRIVEEGVLGPAPVSLIRELYAVRNQAVHATDLDVTPGQAVDFARTAERVIEALKRRTDPQGTG